MKPLGLFFLLVLNLGAKAQYPRYFDDVQAFKAADSISFPASRQILFIGSSSFTMWKDVQTYFPNKKILNRAFGGSTLLDLISYRNDVVYPYAPKQIVMYCGENDFAASDTVSVATVVDRFKLMYRLIRQKYPQVPFVYVSMKPSPSRAHLQKKFELANQEIRDYISHQPKAKFVDVYHAMLDANGKPIAEIFGPDSLHMNAKGYAIWQKKLKPFLK